MTADELATLRTRYGINGLQTCRLCGKPMHLRTIFPNEEPAFQCLRSEARKYTQEWWDHVEQSKTQGGEPRDPLVIKLIEAYDRLVMDYDER